MRQVHRAGEKLFVDYAGMRAQVINPATGEVREANIFVGASNYTYAEATWSQGLEDWIGAHVRCFTYFGGAILDRLVHNAYKINLKGESMRKQKKTLTTMTPTES